MTIEFLVKQIKNILKKVFFHNFICNQIRQVIRYGHFILVIEIDSSYIVSYEIIIKTKNLGDLSRVWLSCLGPYGFLSHKDFYIILVSNLVIFSVRDEAYSSNASCALNLISTFYRHVHM